MSGYATNIKDFDDAWQILTADLHEDFEDLREVAADYVMAEIQRLRARVAELEAIESMDPDKALDHWRAGRFVRSHELVAALNRALNERDQARSERDSLAAALSVADVRAAQQ